MRRRPEWIKGKRTVKNKYVFVLVLLVVILAAGAGLTALALHYQNRESADRGGAEAEGTGSGGEESAAPDGSGAQFTVVTSFYPMYIAAENIVCDCNGVYLENLSEPQTGCLHDYQLTTEDMKLLSTADVFVIGGGGIDSFLSRVTEQYPDLTVIDACEGIPLLDGNDHVWMNVEDYMQQVQNICDGLAASDPDSEHDAVYRRNAEAYEEDLRELAADFSALADEIAGRPVVLFHEAYEYLAKELGLSVAGEMDLDEERQVSAGEVAQILSVIEEDAVSVIFAEELYAKSMGDRMEEETDVTVLYLDPLTRGDYDPDSYLDGMRENLQLIREAYNH